VIKKVKTILKPSRTSGRKIKPPKMFGDWQMSKGKSKETHESDLGSDE